MKPVWQLSILKFWLSSVLRPFSKFAQKHFPVSNCAWHMPLTRDHKSTVEMWLKFTWCIKCMTLFYSPLNLWAVKVHNRVNSTQNWTRSLRWTLTTWAICYAPSNKLIITGRYGKRGLSLHGCYVVTTVRENEKSSEVLIFLRPATPNRIHFLHKVHWISASLGWKGHFQDSQCTFSQVLCALYFIFM